MSIFDFFKNESDDETEDDEDNDEDLEEDSDDEDFEYGVQIDCIGDAGYTYNKKTLSEAKELYNEVKQHIFNNESFEVENEDTYNIANVVHVELLTGEEDEE
jgi:hypothetical protein